MAELINIILISYRNMKIICTVLPKAMNTKWLKWSWGKSLLYPNAMKLMIINLIKVTLESENFYYLIYLCWNLFYIIWRDSYSF